MRAKLLTILMTLVALLAGCAAPEQVGAPEEREAIPMAKKLAQYTPFELTADLSGLTDNERAMIPLLIEAAEAMDDIFWMEAYGPKAEILDSLDDPATRQYATINYGPWDRLDADRPFLDGYGPKPLGARFYPEDMTKEEFEAAKETDETLGSLYTVVRRDESGALYSVPYHEAYAEKTNLAVAKLLEAAALAEDEGLKRYLELRAAALQTDEYFDSDIAWLDMKTNGIDIVIGPIENYEDQLVGAKAAHEAFVLIKDREWSQRLSRYAALLPDLQNGLPVPDAYKAETPGSDSDLNAYDAVYFAGDCNAAVKTIAINLPNDETVQLEKGTRKLQLKNVMRAKFDGILLPISDVLIAEDQRGHIKFDSFFANVMFHEVAHGLGIKRTLDGQGTVREALKDQAGALEEAKADVLGLYMVTKLHEMGELDVDLMDNYVTFLAGFFRSIRFGATSAHGRANTAELAFFQEMGAFSRDEATGTYRVNFDRMQEAVAAMAETIITLQGDGDYEGVKMLLPDPENLDPVLRADLDRLAEADIPVDIVFEQGVSQLGL